MGNFYVNSPISSPTQIKVWNNQTIEHNRFVEGENFQITIKCENNDTFKLIYDDLEGEIDQIKTQKILHDPNYIQVFQYSIIIINQIFSDHW